MAFCKTKGETRFTQQAGLLLMDAEARTREKFRFARQAISANDVEARRAATSQPVVRRKDRRIGIAVLLTTSRGCPRKCLCLHRLSFVSLVKPPRVNTHRHASQLRNLSKGAEHNLLVLDSTLYGSQTTFYFETQGLGSTEMAVYALQSRTLLLQVHFPGALKMAKLS